MSKHAIGASACLLTVRFEGGLGVPHGLPGRGDVQEDGVGHARHPEAVFADVGVGDGDQVVHAVLGKLLLGLLGALLVELHRVQVARRRDGAQNGVRQRAAARACEAKTDADD